VNERALHLINTKRLYTDEKCTELGETKEKNRKGKLIKRKVN